MRGLTTSCFVHGRLTTIQDELNPLPIAGKPVQTLSPSSVHDFPHRFAVHFRQPELVDYLQRSSMFRIVRGVCAIGRLAGAETTRAAGWGERETRVSIELRTPG